MIIQTSTLTVSQKIQIEHLWDECRRAESLSSSPYLSSDLNFHSSLPCFFLLYQDSKKEVLISFLSLFLPSEEDAEIFACTLPDYRNQGCFNSLLEAACRVLCSASIPFAIFVHEPEGRDAANVLETMDADFLYTEYLMILQNISLIRFPLSLESCLRKACPSELYELSALHASSFELSPAVSMSFLSQSLQTPGCSCYKYVKNGILTGLVCISENEQEVVLSGVCIRKEDRQKGYAKEMLLVLFSFILNPCKKVILEVSSLNKSACALYLSLGFSVVSQLDYYGCEVAYLLEILA